MPVLPESLEIVWSSGTGNSRRAALWLQAAARAQGHPAVVRSLQDPPPSLDGASFLLLVYPTHGFTAPWSVFRYLFRLPPGRGAWAALVATRGGGWYLLGPLPGFAGTAAWLPAAVLALKGYRVRGLTGLDLPANWNALHPALNEGHERFWSGRAEPKLRRFLERLRSGRRWFLTPFNLTELLLGIALLPISALYLAFGRFILGQLFFADHQCNSCGLCRDACPEKAIRMSRGRPRWSLRCESCHRCMSICPSKAVQAHQGVLALGIWLTGLACLPLAPLALPGWPQQILRWAALLSMLLLLQRALSWLPREALAGLSLTTLTRVYRRHRERDTRPADLLPSNER